MADFFTGETNAWTLVTIVALAGVSVLSRSLFFISKKDWVLPLWVQRGLQYAPIAALSAVIVPEIVMTQGMLIHTLQDAPAAGLGRAPPFVSSALRAPP